MGICALYPTSTLAQALCFTADDRHNQTEVALFVSQRRKGIDMNSALPGYDAQLYHKLQRLSKAMQTMSAKSVCLLSQRVNFSSEVGNKVSWMVKSLSFSQTDSDFYTSQMESYLASNLRAVSEGEDEEDQVD